MRHRRNFNHLSRKSAHRKSMLANMATSLIIHKRIHTTVAKAKALRSYIEPLITKSKEDTTHSRRTVFGYLQSKEAVTELFREISVKVAERPGGYTRIIKTGTRLGDNAEMCMIELVDYNENLLADAAGKTKSTRRRRGSKKKTDETVAAGTAVTAKGEEAKAEKVEEDVKAEVETEKAEVTEEKTAEEQETKTEAKVETPDTEQPAETEKKEEPAKDEVEEDAEKQKKEEETPKAEAQVDTKTEDKPKEDDKKKEEPKAEKEEPAAEEPKKEEKSEDSAKEKDDTKSESK